MPAAAARASPFSSVLNHFELFGLPTGFVIDSEALSLRYRELQKAAHPDRFAGSSAQEQRLAVEQASRINEGYRVLKSPLLRARHLLELAGVELDDNATAMEPAFLMQQMELREALASVKSKADPFGALAELREDIEARERVLIDELAAAFDHGGEDALERATGDVRKMQFMSKLLQELDEMEEDLVHL